MNQPEVNLILAGNSEHKWIAARLLLAYALTRKYHAMKIGFDGWDSISVF